MTSLSSDAHYQVLVKTNRMYQELNPYQQNFLLLKQSQVTYAYFYLSEEQQNSLKKLGFVIYMPYEFDNDPDLLFFAPQDVTFGETAFIPMPVVSIDREQVWVFKKLTL